MAAAGITATTLSAEPTKQSPLDGCRHLGSIAKRALWSRSLRQMLHLLRVNAHWTQGVDGEAVSIFSGILVLASVTARPLMRAFTERAGRLRVVPPLPPAIRADCKSLGQPRTYQGRGVMTEPPEIPLAFH